MVVHLVAECYVLGIIIVQWHIEQGALGARESRCAAAIDKFA